jgi:4-alpha-glucanotransferase
MTGAKMTMNWTRASGILLHPTSLPGRFGIGDLGSAAYQWVDFLAQSGQKLWQILPLGPTGFADSPYACLSAFACNPMLIGLERLVEQGHLEQADLDGTPEFPVHKVAYGAVIDFKMPLLNKAARHFLAQATPERRDAFDGFCRGNASWLPDLALFMAAKTHHGERIWYEWKVDIALRKPGAVARWRDQLGESVAIVKVLQFMAFEQWQAVKAYANGRGIQIIGDVPIFVAHDSADVWANPELFALDERGRSLLVSGVPPDYFSETGQRWGNPLYRWDVMAERGYAWWVARIKATLHAVDIVRIDHFRGFVAYWEIPASEPTAVRGRWVPGPKAAVFEAIECELGRLPIMVEDLGVITPEVIELRERFGFPGIKVLQFAFDEEALHASFGDYDRNPFLPHNYTADFVVYTGTHDNDTALGWFQHCAPAERQKALAYLNCNEREFNWSLIRAAMASVADIVILPLQDILGLGSEARMNLPGTVGTNWTWRYTSEALTADLAARLSSMVKLYER